MPRLPTAGFGQVEDPIGSYINHSCTPTCQVVENRIVVLHDLLPGTEITFDYTKNGGPLASPFTCAKCGERLTGDPALCVAL